MISDAPVNFLVKLSEDDKNCISLAGPAGMYRGSILRTEVVLNSLASITFSILSIIFVRFVMRHRCVVQVEFTLSEILWFLEIPGVWRYKVEAAFWSSHWPSPPAWHKSFDADNSRTEHQTFSKRLVELFQKTQSPKSSDTVTPAMEKKVIFIVGCHK